MKQSSKSENPRGEWRGAVATAFWPGVGSTSVCLACIHAAVGVARSRYAMHTGMQYPEIGRYRLGWCQIRTHRVVALPKKPATPSSAVFHLVCRAGSCAGSYV